MNQICSRCAAIKSIHEFNFRIKSKGIRQRYCKQCQSVSHKESYEKHKDKTIARSIYNNDRRRQVLYEIKKKLSCSVCGESDPSCLDFHHIESDKKEFLLSAKGTWCGVDKLKEELSKCSVLCANCHRKHHTNRLNASIVKLDITQLFES